MDGQNGARTKQLAGLLAELDRTFRDDFKRNNGVPCNLTLAQYQVISLLADKGERSQKDIATTFGVTGPTVVRIIDALEKKELVRRTRDRVDRRIVFISLTDKGVQAQHECADLQTQRLAVLMDRLPTSTTTALLGNLSALLTAARPSRGAV